MFRRRITVVKVVKAFQTLNARPARGTFANETGICGLQALERAFGYPAIVPLPLNVGFTWGWDAPCPLGVAFAVAAVAWLTLPDVPLFMIHRIGPRLLFWGLALMVVGGMRFCHGVYIGHRSYAAVWAWRCAKDQELAARISHREEVSPPSRMRAAA